MEGQKETHPKPVFKITSTESWDSYLQESKSHGTPVVAHFTASWCIPSVAMNPYFEELAFAFQDITFLVVDVDDLKEIARKYEVKAMPTFLLMKDCVVVGRLVGANPDEMKKRVGTLLQSNTEFVV
ncbi:thioredoxin-like protein CXXS1 [Cynara cardunculus var. scolymus]|uniref:thioredoxin-like protein CXXS1 n=1 Tax=Cynara cardunculus var. scolymus TaxID=59895 RepID=UPI000D6300F4|nr:thioredoxin-like protein CXXS1 [Cynara cardunculus var. scolymus]